MKKGIHPDYKPAKITCACGAVIETHSTLGDYNVEICSQCRPLFPGKQKMVDKPIFDTKIDFPPVASNVLTANTIAAQSSV